MSSIVTNCLIIDISQTRIPSIMIILHLFSKLILYKYTNISNDLFRSDDFYWLEISVVHCKYLIINREN